MLQDIFAEENQMELEFIDASNKRKNTRSRVRKQSFTWSAELTNRLISEVERKDNLWNHTTADYKNRVLRDSSWTDVCVALKLNPKESASEVQNKWSSIRANFRTHLSKINKSKSGDGAADKPLSEPYSLMTFLLPVFNIEPVLRVSNMAVEIHLDDALAASSNTMSTTPETSTSKPSKSRKRARMAGSDDEDCAKMMKLACATMQKISNEDTWDSVGNSVAATGRELASENLRRAKLFKKRVYQLIADFQSDDEID